MIKLKLSYLGQAHHYKAGFSGKDNTGTKIRQWDKRKTKCKTD